MGERFDVAHGCDTRADPHTGSPVDPALGAGNTETLGQNVAMTRIDGDRLLADLRTLRGFGATGTGVVRPTFSETDTAARRWLAERMTAAGLDATIDGVGNVYGRSRNPGPAVLIGSHTDTQPEGGWLDGAMGVIHGLEVARSLAEESATTGLAVDVASWADEEGTYASFLGSRSFVSELGPDDFDRQGPGGESVAAALDRCGYAQRSPARLDPARHRAYLESHIEQGPRLEDEGLQIGVVTAIVGIRSMTVSFVGQQNHAGTTPMARRRDAAAAMFRFGAAFGDRMAAVAGERSVWTIGEVHVHPGAQSIVPGRADLVVQFRDVDAEVLDRMQETVERLADETDRSTPVDVSVTTKSGVDPAPMDRATVDAVAEAAHAVAPGRWTRMPSAAGHDAQVLAPHLPSAMVFIPSIGGLSHDFGEDSDPADIVLGAEVMAEATVRILGGA